MPHNFAGANRPYYGHYRHQENSSSNFSSFVPSQNRLMCPDRTADFKRYQQSNTYQYWCETCDRGFKTIQQVEGHKLQHQKCNIDGCQFVAHPKVITKHIQMQHSSGLYKRIAKLDNPEEIKKWIEERKKKYPTKENIEKKSAEIKEKIERGEKMGLREKRFQRDYSKGFKDGAIKRKNNYNSVNCSNQPIKRHARQNHGEKSKNNLKSMSKQWRQQPKNVNTVTPIDETRKLKPFMGIQNVDMDSDSNEEIEKLECHYDIEDDETLGEFEQGKTIREPTVCGALTSLMCNYGSSDEENDMAKEFMSKSYQNTVKIRNNSNEIKVNTEVPNGTEGNKSDEDSGPEEVNVVKTVDVHTTSIETVTRNVAKKQTTKKNICNIEHKKHSFIRAKPKVPSSLLQKLLQKEVQHERNVILQCVRYIVKNNYFNKTIGTQ